MNFHTLFSVEPMPDGPRIIGERHQMTLPADQLAAIGVGPRDTVWVAVNPDRPGTLVVIPEAVMREVFMKGWTAV